MKVRELIKELADQDPDKEVVYSAGSDPLANLKVTNVEMTWTLMHIHEGERLARIKAVKLS